LTIPPEQNPVADTNGQFAAVGQSGPVWFLAGTLGGAAERTVTVPAGKALFFPMLNNLWVTTCVGDPRTIAEIRPLIAPFIDAAQGLDVEIDGVSVANLAEYLVESPLFCTSLTLFGVNVAADLAAFCPGGTPYPDCGNLPNPQEHYGTPVGFGPAMTIGYHLMLAPLKAGHHTIHFTATSGDFSVDVTYHLTVK